MIFFVSVSSSSLPGALFFLIFLFFYLRFVHLFVSCVDPGRRKTNSLAMPFSDGGANVSMRDRA